jgi:hypothetical protein
MTKMKKHQNVLELYGHSQLNGNGIYLYQE